MSNSSAISWREQVTFKIFTDDCDDKKVMFEDEVDQVMVTVDTPSQYNCDMCGGSFNSMDQFMNHRNTYCLEQRQKYKSTHSSHGR
jgi:hypothetical protein